MVEVRYTQQSRPWRGPQNLYVVKSESIPAACFTQFYTLVALRQSKAAQPPFWSCGQIAFTPLEEPEPRSACEQGVVAQSFAY